MADSSPLGQRPRENWASKIGVILAVSGSAVGLGNFLRFPGQAAANGGGAFMIPYFISLLVLGIPICWAEWTLGRQGGRLGFNSAPGVLFALTGNPVLRLFGGLAVLIPVVIYMYYVYIEAWCLGYAYDYMVGNMRWLGLQIEAYTEHFNQFVGSEANGFLHLPGQGEDKGVSRVVYFLVIVFTVNFVLIYRGVTRGIERFCKYAMPVLIVAALVVLVRVLTLPPQPVPEPWQYSLADGLPAAKWNALLEKLDELDAALVALEADGAEAVDEQALADAEEAPGKAITDAVADYYRGSIRGEPGYTAGVAVAAPYGYLVTPEGIRYALGQLEDTEGACVHREWVRRTRSALTREQVWDLLHYEARGAELSGVIEDPEVDPRERKAARQELARKRAERRRLIEAIGPPPGLASATAPDAYLRGAAAEVSELERTVVNGLGFMWNPFTARGGRSVWAALSDPQVWLAASSQIFFSLSVGFGIIMTYSTYLRRNDDVVLNGLTAAATNEFCEVCLGGLITIPAAFIFLGLGAVQGAGTFDLGFLTTPTVFAQMPAGQLFGFIWFSMLLLAAVTSSLSMLQPAIAFLEEGFSLNRRGSVALLGLLTANGTLVVLYFSEGLTGLDTMDFWVGNLCIFVMATVMVILFSWVIGAGKGFKLAQEGAELKIPGFFVYLIKYVSPVYLLVIFGLWLYHNAGDYVDSVVSNNGATFTVVFVILVMIFFGVLVRLANVRWAAQGRGVQEIQA
ncbi:MAG: hypothetical protein JSV19_07895 [Phycisphaerales bacterium]|nr:MAG: hypothetical protein JSV19_07895 [Phycisphaerales bacterium]